MRWRIRTFLLDWEVIGKAQRQANFDTEIRPGTAGDLEQLARVQGATVWCRLNAFGSHTAAEIEKALACGARGLFLPMVSSIDEVERFLQLVRSRCQTGILLETVGAVNIAEELAELPFDRVYFGLNDFAISRGKSSIFDPVLDRTVETMRHIFADKNFGFAGITAVDAGYPVPARLLIAEMARLDCDFCFLRRSFRRDLETRDPVKLVESIEAYWRQCRERDCDAVRRDRLQLESCLNAICSG